MRVSVVILVLLMGLSSFGVAQGSVRGDDDFGTLSEYSLKVVTFNAGFLKIFTKEYPFEYQQRLSYLPEQLGGFIRSEQPDVIALQEVWHWDAAKVVRRLAKIHGYISIAELMEIREDREPDTWTGDIFDWKMEIVNHGLDLLVRKELLAGDQFGFQAYYNEDGKLIRTWRLGALPNYFRGVIWAGLQINDQVIKVMNTHLPPKIGNTSTRKDQLQALAAIINQSPQQIKVVAGDFNVAPNFSYSVDGRTRDGTVEEWTKNGGLYNQFVDLTNLVDTYRTMNPSLDGFTQDRMNNDLADYSSWTWKEPEQRLDFIFVSQGPCRPVDSAMIFVEPISRNGSPVKAKSQPKRNLFLSDHFGIVSELSCAL